MATHVSTMVPGRGRAQVAPGASLATEYDSGGVVTARFVGAGGLGAPVMEYDGSGTGTREWLLTDERGSVIGRADGSGNIVAGSLTAYDEYGMQNTGNPGTYGYTGMVRLDNGALTHNRNRAYHARLGRFLHTDPIGQAGGLNVYAYVEGDPINRWDPMGTCGVLGAAIGGAVGFVGGTALGIAGAFTSSRARGQGDPSIRSVISGAAQGAFTGTATGAVFGATCGLSAVATGIATAATAGTTLLFGPFVGEFAADILWGPFDNEVNGPAVPSLVSVYYDNTWNVIACGPAVFDGRCGRGMSFAIRLRRENEGW